MTNLRSLVGTRIRDIRKARGLTQQQLAELSNLDDAYIGSLERGERNFSIDSLDKIVEALGVAPSDFFERYEKENKLEAARRSAIDDYSAVLNGLSAKQIEAMKRVVKEVGGALGE